MSTEVIIAIGVVLWLLIALFVLGLCRAAAAGDALMEEYYAELRRRDNR